MSSIVSAGKRLTAASISSAVSRKLGTDQLSNRCDSSRTASKALGILQEHRDELQGAVSERRRKEEDFTFTYEEEADPEVFFVPYVWEVIVGAVTSGTLDWNQDEIRVFALLDKVEVVNSNGMEEAAGPTNFSQDVSDVV